MQALRRSTTLSHAVRRGARRSTAAKCRKIVVVPKAALPGLCSLPSASLSNKLDRSPASRLRHFETVLSIPENGIHKHAQHSTSRAAHVQQQQYSGSASLLSPPLVIPGLFACNRALHSPAQSRGLCSLSSGAFCRAAARQPLTSAISSSRHSSANSFVQKRGAHSPRREGQKPPRWQQWIFNTVATVLLLGVGAIVFSFGIIFVVPVLSVALFWRYGRVNWFGGRFAPPPPRTLSQYGASSQAQQQQQRTGLSGWWEGVKERIGMYIVVNRMNQTLEMVNDQMETVHEELVAKARMHPRLSKALGPNIIAEPFEEAVGVSDDQGPRLKLICTLKGQRGTAKAEVSARGVVVKGENTILYESIHVVMKGRRGAPTQHFDLTDVGAGSFKKPSFSTTKSDSGTADERIVEAEFKEKK